MAKSRKKQHKKSASKRTHQSIKKPVRRNFMKIAIRTGIVLVLGSGVAVGLASYKKQYEFDHDLSVIGNGKPTVVQIHDPSCRLCLELKDGVDSVRRDFEDEIQFRIASIKTLEGRTLAQRHNVPHVTLLLFNGRGKMVRTIRGVQSGEDLKPAFSRLSKSG